MTRALLACLLLAAPAVAGAAERRVGIGSFDRLRITGPFQVSVATGASPGATLSGDARAIEDVELQSDGSTLTLRMRPGVAGMVGAHGVSAAPIAVTLATPSLATIMVVGGAKVKTGPMRAERVEVSIAGAGSLAIASADAAQVNATLIGAGAMVIGGGRAARARLVVNGPGGIDAAALESDSLVVRVEGLGETKARARYTADVTDTGQGSVTVAGAPKCTLHGVAGATIICGK